MGSLLRGVKLVEVGFSEDQAHVEVEGDILSAGWNGVERLASDASHWLPLAPHTLSLLSWKSYLLIIISGNPIS